MSFLTALKVGEIHPLSTPGFGPKPTFVGGAANGGSLAQSRHGPASILADAATQLNETISCAAERKVAVGAIRSKLDRGYDRVHANIFG